MTELDVVGVMHDAVMTALKMASPLLLAPLLTGLAISVLQAVTQINDSGLAFLPKLFATGATAWVTAPLLSHEIVDFMHEMLNKLVAIGGQ